MSKNKENKEAQIERISRLEEEISRKTQEKIQQNMEFKDSLEAIAAILDQGYCDTALSEACTMAYLPTRIMPRFLINSTKNRVDAWVTSDNYETALIELSEEARNVEILKCEVEKTYGFFFSKESHYWSIH